MNKPHTQHIMKKIYLLIIAICTAAAAMAGTYNEAQTDSAATASSQRLQLAPAQEKLRDYCFLEAQRKKQAQLLSSAYYLFDYCLKIDSTAAEAWNEIALLQLMINDKENALHSMKQAVKYAPDNYWYRIYLANYYIASNNTADAIAQMEEVTRLFPAKKQALYTLVALYEQNNQFEEAIGALEKIEDKEGKTEEITLEKVKTYIYMGDRHKAIDEVKELVAQYPAEPRYMILLGNICMENDMPDEAVKAYTEVLKQDPDNESALYSMAQYHKEQGDTALYRKECDAILANPEVGNDFKSDMMRAFFNDWQADKDTAEMTRKFHIALKADKGEDAMMYMLYASFLLEVDSASEEIVPVLEKALEIEPEQGMARIELLSQYARRNDLKNLTRICEGGVKLHPEIFQFYFYLAIAYYQADRIDDAIAVCELSKNAITDNITPEAVSELYGILGDLYHTKGDNEKAFASYETSLENNPDNYSVLNNYSYYLSLMDTDLDKAEKMARRAVEANPDNGTFLDTYAWILFLQRNYGMALTYIDKALEDKENSSGDVLEHAGDIYYMNGFKDKALEFWKQAKDKGGAGKLLDKKIKRKKYIKQ